VASDRVTRTATAFLLAGALAAFPATAFADPSLSDRETARALMDEGDAKRDKNDLRGALKAYEAADAIMKVPTTGLEVGRTQAALGLLLEARETLGRVARIPPKAGEPAPFVAARKAAETLSAELATRIPSVTVVVQNAEQSPQLVFDGEAIPPAASQAARKVNPGKHTILVRAGTTEKTEEVTVAEREQRTVTVDLTPRKPEPAATLEPATSGSGSGPWKALMVGGFAVGAVGVAVGSVTGILSIAKVSDVKDDCVDDRCKPSRASDIESAKSLGNISTVSFVVGGVGAVVGVVGLVMSNKSSSEAPPPATTARVRPVLGAGYVGLTGAF